MANKVTKIYYISSVREIAKPFYFAGIIGVLARISWSDEIWTAKAGTLLEAEPPRACQVEPTIDPTVPRPWTRSHHCGHERGHELIARTVGTAPPWVH
jgi:hypothetical protein